MAMQFARPLLGLLVAAALTGSAGADDGQIEINQAIAMAGGVNGRLVTDPPGFLVTIREAGSYRLTSDLSNAANVHVISVEIEDVTIDLGGYTIRGGAAPATCSGDRRKGGFSPVR